MKAKAHSHHRHLKHHLHRHATKHHAHKRVTHHLHHSHTTKKKSGGAKAVVPHHTYTGSPGVRALGGGATKGTGRSTHVIHTHVHHPGHVHALLHHARPK